MPPTTQSVAPAAPQATSRTNGQGKVRNASVAGVHHIIQTGVYCGACGIGVEHHWRHCPLCAGRLI
jgi:DnaJ-class molecular chaperone